MITVHGRTRTQGFSGKSDLEIIRRVREAVPRHVPVVGNGDVVDVEGHKRMRGETGCDAVMIGRGAMGNPWLFRSIRAIENGEEDPGPPSVEERVTSFRRHTELIRAHAPAPKQIHELRKACVWYAKGLHGANALRQRAWSIDDADALLAHAEEFFEELARRLTSRARVPLMDRAQVA